MAIKQSEYTFKTAAGEDVFHFQTNDNMVKIVDDKLAVLGSFKEFAFEGKIVTSGAFTALKVSGIYKVKGVTGLPAGFAIDKTAILSVKAVGKIAAPEFATYTLISQEGAIYHNTVVGTKESGWSEGGTTLQNTLTTILKNIGTLSQLNTSVKSSIVGAINEVSTKATTATTGLSDLKKDYDIFKNHNHDTIYLKKSGDTIDGELALANTIGISSTDSQGRKKKIVSTNALGDMVIGNDDSSLDFKSKTDMTVNGNKIWTETNGGFGSKLDAGLLGGVQSGQFARRDEQNDFQKHVLVKEGHNFYLDESTSKNGGAIYWRNSEYVARGSIKFDSTGRMDIHNNGARFTSITGTGRMETWSGHDLYATDREINMIFRLNGGDKGIGFYRNNNTKYFGMYDWGNNGGKIFHVNPGTRLIAFDNEITIQGRKLYLQGATPGGARTVGDIWFA